MTTPPDESQASLLHHGGNLDAARARFPQAPLPWIDLSTGINPQPWPVGAVSPGAWQRLPGAAAAARLNAAAARRYGTSVENIVAAPGTQALIQWLPRLIEARNVAVLGFSYAGHARVWAAAGAKVIEADEMETLAACDVAVVVNPNNPDGRLVAWRDLAALAAAMARRGGTLIVDEAFIDVLPGDASLVPHLTANAIILRSFGKTYGLAGLRLGFAIAAPAIAARLRAALGPWAVAGPALEIGARALDDDAWLAATTARLATDAQRLDTLLHRAGFAPAGGTPLYRLARHERSAEWFAHLGARGILGRPFAARPHWLRFGLPGAEADWARGAAARGGGL